MYTIVTNINNRRQWISELKESHTQRRDAEFVVEFDKINMFNLFSIRSNANLMSFIENTIDIQFSDLNVSFSAQGNNIHIALSENEKQPMPQVIKNNIQETNFFNTLDEEKIEKRLLHANEYKRKEEFNLESKDVQFICTHTQTGIYVDAKIHQLNERIFDIKNLTITISFNEFSSKLKINICHPKQFLGIALDFGSEASQLAVSTYYKSLSNPAMPINEDLFEDVKNLMLNKGIIEQEATADYYQEEKGTKFFKSIFFIKSDLGAVDIEFNKEKFLRNAESNLKILVDKDSGKELTQAHNKHYQLPNMKIVHGHLDILDEIKFKITRNNYPATISLNHIVEKVHNSVLNYLIESYIQKDFAIHEQERYVRMTLLVPNIYDSEAVLTIQENIQEILHSFQQKNIGNIIGYEVITISESDAALVGYMSKQDTNIEPNKQYIVIDAGKGTTDFSVVKTGNEDIFKIVPLYRNGFAGAGNLITNAIFETLLHYIRDKNIENPDIQHIIRTKILEPLKNDLAIRNEFFNQLEKLKKGYVEDKNIITQWDNASSGSIKLKHIAESGVDINTIISILERIESVSDFYQYIETATETITEKVIVSLEILNKSMKEVHYAGAILTGRGFLFQPLYKNLEQKIKARLGVAASTIFLLKNNELKDVCIKGVFNRSMQINSEVIGYPIQKIKTEKQYTESKKAPIPTTSILEKVKKLLGSIEGEETTYVFSQNNPFKANQLRNSTFLIGSKSYSIPNDDHFFSSIQDNSEIKIEYTSHGYALRHLQNGKVIRICDLQNTFELANIDKNIIIPSLFPNYINTDYLESMRAQFKPTETRPNETITTEKIPLSSIPKTTFDELKF